MIKIKKYLCAAFISLFILSFCHTAFAFTGHPIRALTDGGNDWRITSMPKSVTDDKIFQSFGFINRLPYILVTRKDGIWDKLMPKGGIKLKVYSDAEENAKTLMKVLDEIVPATEIISLCYYSFINEAVIYFHPNRWKDEEFHKNIAEKLNDARAKELE